MKILFYLPVVTPWWFDNIVEPLIRRVATIAEVHILAPEPWRNTGIGPAQLERCVDLPQLNWAIVNGSDHPTLRTCPHDPTALIDYVAQVAPDYVLCRTADFETARRFPGTLRFLMEVASAPFSVDPSTTAITDEPFIDGAMPMLSDGERDRLETLIAPLWSEMSDHWQCRIPGRAELFSLAGIPDDRPVLLLPLEYEHEENFFLQHRLGATGNAALVEEIAERVAQRCTLVVTNHPLNLLFVDDSALQATVGELGGRVILADAEIGGIPASLALARHADGMLLGNSKTFSLAACFGTPMMRRSRFRSADWLNVETDLDRFIEVVLAGSARRPAEADARLWFAYHLANEAFHPTDTTLTGEEIVDRIERPVNMERWAAGIDRVTAVKEKQPQ